MKAKTTEQIGPASRDPAPRYLERMDIAALHAGNRDAWNRTARGGYGQDIDADVALLENGGTNLMPNEIRVLGNINKDQTIHLQCSHGLDALSIWKLGAKEIIGVDISEEMLAAAKQKSDALNAPATWIRADVLETPTELNATADLVYTGRGAICWMMDLERWAATVARLLKPGGHLFLFEGHPLDFLWETEASTYELRPGAAYFTAAPEEEKASPTKPPNAPTPKPRSNSLQKSGPSAKSSPPPSKPA